MTIFNNILFTFYYTMSSVYLQCIFILDTHTINSNVMKLAGLSHDKWGTIT